MMNHSYDNANAVCLIPIVINGETYYQKSEACQTVGMTMSALLRWPLALFDLSEICEAEQ